MEKTQRNEYAFLKKSLGEPMHKAEYSEDMVPVAGGIHDQITKEDFAYVERDSAKVSYRYNPFADDIKKQRRHLCRLLKTVK